MEESIIPVAVSQEAGTSIGNACNLAELIRSSFSLKPVDIRSYSPLTLAYIGDAVYDMIIRTMLVAKANAPVNQLHRQASSMVKATAQMEALRRLEPYLTEEETGIYKRGRNAKSFTTAKNASVADYRGATGFEALLGFLYLSGRMGRIMELAVMAVDKPID